MDRRTFIKGCASGMALLSLPNLNLFSQTHPQEGEHCFVVVFLRGGCDGLNLVAPASDAHYQNARAWGMKVGTQGGAKGLFLNNGLDDIGFHLHWDAPELHELYQQGDLAIIHACGLPNGTRSHFEAMALIEQGISKDEAHNAGWMSRLLWELDAKGKLPGISTSSGLPESFSGYANAACIPELSEFALSEGHAYPNLLRKWHSGDSQLEKSARTTLRMIDDVANLRIRPGNKVVSYPQAWYEKEMGRNFSTLAKLIRSDGGVRVAMVDHIGWDTHENQREAFPRQVKSLSKNLSMFYQDLGHRKKDVTILVMSEFGRRLKSNRSGGTDHGYGNMMMVLGEGVRGGRMYGQWPGLHADQLDNGVDLGITTDYRAVLSEILTQRMGLANTRSIFPGYIPPAPLKLFG